MTMRTIAEIAARVPRQEHRLRVRTSGERAREALCALPGVTDVQALPPREQGWQEWLVRSRADVAAQVSPALSCVQARLRMLYPMDVDLEDIFMKLMQGEAEPCEA